jgi:hypothetical protein
MQRLALLKRMLGCSVLLALALTSLHAEQGAAWHTASESDLKALIPARALVGITDGEHHFIAGVVLITAGYSAEGKYSHFLIVQAPIKVGEMLLAPGQYVFGWTHNEDSLTVNFYEAASGKPLGSVEATLNPSIKSVASFRVWPPADKSVMQIGRFSFPYQIAP